MLNEVARRPGAAPGATSFGDSYAQAGARRTIKILKRKAGKPMGEPKNETPLLTRESTLLPQETRPAIV